MRPISAANRGPLAQQSLSVVVCCIVAIDAGATRITLTDNTEEVRHRGEVYIPWPMRARMGPEGPDRQASVQLVLSNVTQDLAAALRALPDAPQTVLEVVRLQPAAESIVTVDGAPVTVDGEDVTVSSTGAAPWGVHSTVQTIRRLAARNLTIDAATIAVDLRAAIDLSDARFPPRMHDGRFRGLYP